MWSLPLQKFINLIPHLLIFLQTYFPLNLHHRNNRSHRRRKLNQIRQIVTLVDRKIR